MKLTHRRGFTVVELAVAIAIIAVLASITVVAFNKVQVDSRDQKRQTDMLLLAAELDKYYAKNSEYPSGCSNYITAQATSCDVAGALVYYGVYRPYSDTSITSLRTNLPGIGEKFGDPRGVSGVPFSKANGTTNRYVYRGGYNGVGATGSETALFGTSSSEIDCGTGQTFGYIIPAGSGKVTSYMAAYYSEGDTKWYIYQGKFGEQLIRNDTDAKLRGSTLGNCVFVS